MSEDDSPDRYTVLRHIPGEEAKAERGKKKAGIEGIVVILTEQNSRSWKNHSKAEKRKRRDRNSSCCT